MQSVESLTINKMKAKTIIFVLSGLIAGSLAVSAQDNPTPAPAATQDSAAKTPDSPAAPAPGAPAVEPVKQDTAATAPADTQKEAAPAPAPAATAPTSAADKPAATPASVVAQAENPATTPAPTASPSNPAQAAVIPLIVMDDVPLTDAIKNLARQASLNYMLDPNISFGQIGPDGKPIPQPTVAIRWENVTAAQALNALLNNYGLQLVEDNKTKIARITRQDPAAPPPLLTKIVKLNYASPSNLVASVQSTFTDKRSRVLPDIRSSQLVLVGTEREIEEASKLVEQLDEPTKQVLIGARIMETQVNPTSIKGIDWTGTLQNQNLAFGNNLNGGPLSGEANSTLSSTFPKMLLDTAKGFNPATAFLDADGVSAVLSYLDTENDTKTIATPHAVTLDNEMTSLEVIEQYPVVNVTAGTANTTGGSSISYTNVGVKLRVTPHISANNYVNLKVWPEISSHEKDIQFTVSAGSTIPVPVFNSRTIETAVLIPSGYTVVLGGLVQDNLTTGETKVPILGDIPGLGSAFRHNNNSRSRDNLLIFITPTIVQDSDFQPGKDDFLKTPSADVIYDAKKPYDWSNVSDVRK